MKIISVLVVIAASIIAISCANLNNNTKTDTSITAKTTAQWKDKAPQLFANAGYGLVESNTTTNQNISESQAELIGVITNPFGIRDDVLDYTLTKIPESNIRARVSAIKMAYFYQKEIGVTDDKELNDLDNKAAAGIYCISLSIQDSDSYIKGYDKLIRNTPARLAEQRRIEHLLNGHVISADFGIDTYDFKKQCNYFLGMQ